MIVALLVTLLTLKIWIDKSQAVQSEIDKLEKLQSTLKKQNVEKQEKQNSLSPQEIQRAKDHEKIIASLNYPWNQIFGEIEQTQESGVAVLGFSHDQGSGASQLTAEALNTPAIIRYAKQLNGDNGDGRWYISNYQVQAQNLPQTVKANLLSK